MPYPKIVLAYKYKNILTNHTNNFLKECSSFIKDTFTTSNSNFEFKL